MGESRDVHILALSRLLIKTERCKEMWNKFGELRGSTLEIFRFSK